MSPTVWAELANRTLAPATLALLSMLAARTEALLTVSTRVTRWRTAIGHLDHIVADVVRELSARQVAALKSVRHDRKIDASAQALLRAAALAITKRHLGPRGLAELSSVLGFAGPSRALGLAEAPPAPCELDAFLTTRIEAQVYCEKLRLTLLAAGANGRR